MPSCSYEVPNLHGSLDEFYGNRMNEWEAFFEWAWTTFNFDAGDWDEGDEVNGIYGGFPDQKWSRTHPIGRTMAAIYCLVDSPGWGNWDEDGSFLEWAWRYVARHTDELDARCLADGDTADRRIFAKNSTGVGVDDRTELYSRFFFEENVVARAATLVHEARHADAGKDHDDDSLDPDWDYSGAFMWEVLWLWWYSAAAIGPTFIMRRWAARRARALVQNAFANPPTHIQIPDP